MIMGTERVGLAFAKMGQSLVLSAINGFEQMALKSLESEMLIRAQHEATVTVNASADAAGAAQHAAIMGAATLKDVTNAAVGAAAKAFDWASGWGGPIAGGIAAAATFSAVEAFGAMAAFEEGSGYIPRTGMAILHQGEAVIPAPTMNELRGSSVGDSSVSVHQENHFHGSSDSMIAAYIDRNPKKIASAVQKHLRNTGRG
jgi:hypothetical protein